MGIDGVDVGRATHDQVLQVGKKKKKNERKEEEGRKQEEGEEEKSKVVNLPTVGEK